MILEEEEGEKDAASEQDEKDFENESQEGRSPNEDDSEGSEKEKEERSEEEESKSEEEEDSREKAEQSSTHASAAVLPQARNWRRRILKLKKMEEMESKLGAVVEKVNGTGVQYEVDLPSDPPFTKEVMDVPLPPKKKMPQISPYKGTTDPRSRRLQGAYDQRT